MLNFENARVLTLGVENKFFGETFRYATTKSLTIQGSLYNLTNGDGVAGIWSGISGVISSANDYDDILLRGVSFGPGRIESVRFSEGIDVRKKEYQIAVTIFESGNLFNLSGQYYNGLDFAQAKLIERFSESFEISVTPNRDWTKQQQVSCKLVAGAPANDTIPIAKAFASGLFRSRPDFGFISSEFSGLNSKTGVCFYNESYNIISKECSFSENCTISASLSGDYALAFNYQNNLDERGIFTVEEHGKIQGVVAPREVSAESGFQLAISSAYSRCTGQYAIYGPTGASLNSIRTVLSKKVNSYDGTIEYSVAFNNDTSIHANYTWEYTQELRRENCISTITEQGRIRGITTTCTFAERFSNALAGYNTVAAGFETRAESFMPGLTNLRQVSFSEAKSMYLGEISYTTTYSDQLINTTSGLVIRKVEQEMQDEMPVQLINKFVGYGFGGVQGKEIVQPAGIATPGRRSATVKVYGYRGADRDILLNEAKVRFNAMVPAGDTYVTNCGYTFDVVDTVVNARATWTFFSDWQFADLTA